MKTRYEIGQKVVACFYFLEGSRGFLNPLFQPWQDKIKNFDAKLLDVKEHHHVAWDQDPRGEKKYDGFVLQDASGQTWANQFPSASYGQVSDNANWYFNKLMPDGFDYKTSPDSELVIYEDVTTVMARVQRGVSHLSKMDSEKAKQLQVHLSWLEKKIEKEFGCKVGVVEPYPDIRSYVLTWP